MKKHFIIFALSATCPSFASALECPSVTALETVLRSKIESAVEDFFEKKEVIIEGPGNIHHHSPILIHNLFYKFPRHTKMYQEEESPNRITCAYYIDPKDTRGSNVGIFMHFDIEKLQEKK